MPKLLWVSVNALHDTSSGGAIQARLILHKMKARGVDVRALCGMVFDHPHGMTQLSDIRKNAPEERTVLQIDDNGLPCTYVSTETTDPFAYTSAEQNYFMQQYLKMLHNYRPDMIMGYGGDVLSLCMCAEARRRGIPVVYLVLNGNYEQFHFTDIDLILTDSQATSDFYAQRGINTLPIAEWIQPEAVLATERKPEYVTLVNPIPAKGCAILARMALMAQKELPDLKFLTLDARGDFPSTLPLLHEADSTSSNLTPDMFPNVVRAANVSDMRPVYAVTRVLLAPSLWYESWGRVATEAVINGIPVLASTSGGLPEAVNGGGICLEAPLACRQDWRRLPTEEEMRPWMDALKRLLSEDWTEQCARAAKAQNIEARADYLREILQSFFDRRASLNPQLLRSGMSMIH